MIRPVLLAIAVFAATIVPVPAGATERPEPRWHDGACAPDDQVGVTIVVDFQDLGGGVNVRCTERAPTDGADALDAAGIAWQGVVRWGRGFVCRIAGKPADDPCIDTPPASAYWSYWLAPRGGRWCYSNLGVLSRTPPPGSVEGWSFSLDRDGGQSPPPRMAPPAAAPGTTPRPLGPDDCDPSGGSVPTTTTTTTTTTSTTAPVASTRPDEGPGPTQPGTSGPRGSTTTTTGPGGSTTTTTASTTTTSTAPGRTDGERPAEEEGSAVNPTDLSADGSPDGGGVPVSTVAGSVAVVALAAGAALTARRRRAGR